jgi:hypothetical protein
MLGFGNPSDGSAFSLHRAVALCAAGEVVLPVGVQI